MQTRPDTIRAATSADAPAIAAIYNHYVANTTITFEEAEVTSAEIGRRIDAVQSAGLPWLVVANLGEVSGYAYATKWKERSAYRHSVESTVYLRNGFSGKGLAAPLYQAMLEELRQRGIHAVIAGIAQPNAGSVGLHEKLGFRHVANFSEVGKKFGRWIDVGYWQLLL
ncbi:arsinothricin resistance N-acetyltransferase ArsN1 family B [Noviherbaspirillum galbum]|uniref:N-acetyltransferase n=1 Tax=Noviherbaspirillum galbum TaxID=2709383 RepID=A0A6B3SRF3_9BURK|nr:arsinothricin resistance N-acetyltransferase ArsN1 family B [Noviherbaspirillum galbum]NEX61915.1 N-acetyltransferase [Noviherbaspirillum galbum]